MATTKIDTDRIRKFAQSVLVLPTLPTVVSKMLKMIDSRRTSADTLARLISTDQALTARLLKLANSAYYGYPREISTVNMAIVVLGFNTVKDMGLWLSVFDSFKNTSGQSAPGFDRVKFWEHSAACGVAARMLSKNGNSRYSGEAFVAGLLHDMGKMILNQYFAPEFAEVLEASRDMGLEAAELEAFGVSHGQVGAWLAEKWNLPEIIRDTVKHHHEPWNAVTDQAFVAMTTVADLICHSANIGSSGRDAAPRYDDRLWDIFDKAAMPLDETDLDRLQSEFLLEYDKSEAYVSVVQDSGDGGGGGTPL